MASPVSPPPGSSPGCSRSARSVLRMALAATVAVSMVIRPGIAAAQFAPGDTLIRDTEIEDTLRKDATPLFQAAGINPKGIQIVLVGSKELNASAGPGVMMVT